MFFKKNMLYLIKATDKMKTSGAFLGAVPWRLGEGSGKRTVLL